MAFGRDGSELEIYTLDLQKKILADAMDSILEINGDAEIEKIVKTAINRVKKLNKRLDPF